MYAVLFKIYRENVSFFEAEKKKGKIESELWKKRNSLRFVNDKFTQTNCPL